MAGRAARPRTARQVQPISGVRWSHAAHLEHLNMRPAERQPRQVEGYNFSPLPTECFVESLATTGEQSMAAAQGPGAGNGCCV